MPTPWFIDKDYYTENRQFNEKLTEDSSGVGSDLFKAYRDAAREYDEVSKLYVIRDANEEDLQEKEDLFNLHKNAWLNWVNS